MIHLYDLDTRVQSRRGLLETLDKLVKEESELLERTAWSFRLYFPNKEAAVKYFTDEIMAVSKNIEHYLTEVFGPSGQNKEPDQETITLMQKFADKKGYKFMERVQFIEDYPQLFVVPKVDRYSVQGVRFSMDRAVCFDDPIKNERVEIAEPGKGTIVTVVDRNDFMNPNEGIHFYLKSKMTNPNENCYVGDLDPSPENIKSAHATFVASIIAVYSNKCPIGLARSARIQLMPCYMACAKSYTRKEVVPEREPAYDELYYRNLLNTFQRGERVISDGHRTTYLCMAQKGLEDQPDLKELPLEECLPPVDGNIINFSISFQSLKTFLPKNKAEGGLGEYFFWWYQLSVKRKLLVKSAGNESLNAGSGFMFRFVKVLASHPSTSENFIMVTNLNVDGLHPNPNSVLPGKHLGLQSRTISAIGTEIEGLMNSSPALSPVISLSNGTSLSAPFISATAAIIEGQFPKLTMAQIGRCILDSATPIILVGSNPYFLKPVALDMMSYELIKPGIYLDTEGKPREVTQEMIEMSRETYGQGRVHVERALKLASLMSKNNDVPAA